MARPLTCNSGHSAGWQDGGMNGGFQWGLPLEVCREVPKVPQGSVSLACLLKHIHMEVIATAQSSIAT
jgi:hypothetical protein